MSEKTGQILFLRKNHFDLDRPNPTIAVTDTVAISDGANSLVYLRNRNNISGWVTTGSTDAANTTLVIEFGDYLLMDYISLIKNNFKSYLIEWRDELTVWNEYVNVVANTLNTNVHQKDTPVLAQAIRITITGTKVVDADKELRQLIITEKKYQFAGWPVISRPVHSLNRKNSKVLSGKLRSVTSRGSFSCTLQIKISSDDRDLTLHERIYCEPEGILMSLSGALESQFLTSRVGYRDEDIVLVKTPDDFTNPYEKGVYKIGQKIKIKIEESID